jgi:phosphatidylserine/phosphatidylglycerophosphate/cardiolipin synthase-like enzyme
LRKKVEKNLHVCFIRQKRGRAYANGLTIGMHAKHFIIDDTCTYIGSQNFYICDLAEWGVVIDDEATTKRMVSEYWGPMWSVSYTGEDCDVQAVMDGLSINRDGEKMTVDQRRQWMKQAKAKQQGHLPPNLEMYMSCDEDEG